MTGRQRGDGTDNASVHNYVWPEIIWLSSKSLHLWFIEFVRIDITWIQNFILTDDLYGHLFMFSSFGLVHFNKIYPIFWFLYAMITSWHGNTFCITVPVQEDYTDHQWIHLTKVQRCGALEFFLLVAWPSYLVYNQSANIASVSNHPHKWIHLK